MNPLQQLNEYLAKLKQPAAVFNHTHKGPDNLRIFRASTKVLGKTYLGDKANNKREASYNCARKVLADLESPRPDRTYVLPARPDKAASRPPARPDRTYVLSDWSWDGEGELEGDLEEIESLDSEDEVPARPSQGGTIGIVDYENMPGAVELLARLPTTYIVVGANHPKCDTLVSKPPNNTIIIVQPSSLRDASDTMIVLLVGKLLSSPNAPEKIVVATRDKFASLVMAVVNDQPYQVSTSGETKVFGTGRVSVVTTEAQVRRLGL